MPRGRTASALPIVVQRLRGNTRPRGGPSTAHSGERSVRLRSRRSRNVAAQGARGRLEIERLAIGPLDPLHRLVCNPRNVTATHQRAECQRIEAWLRPPRRLAARCECTYMCVPKVRDQVRTQLLRRIGRGDWPQQISIQQFTGINRSTGSGKPCSLLFAIETRGQLLWLRSRWRRLTSQEKSRDEWYPPPVVSVILRDGAPA